MKKAGLFLMLVFLFILMTVSANALIEVKDIRGTAASGEDNSTSFYAYAEYSGATLTMFQTEGVMHWKTYTDEFIVTGQQKNTPAYADLIVNFRKKDSMHWEVTDYSMRSHPFLGDHWTGQSYTIAFPDAGEYEVRVASLSNKAELSYAHESTCDQLTAWLPDYWVGNPPSWYVASTSGCNCYIETPVLPTPTIITPDPNTVLYYNPSGGSYYHYDQYCRVVNDRYLPLTGRFTFAEINNTPYNFLSPCSVCCPPEYIRESGITFPTNVATGLPVLTGDGYPAYLNNPIPEYVKPQCGPGDEYQVFRSMDGRKHLYQTSEIGRADIYFTVGNWAYVGFSYGNKWMYGFFRNTVFIPYDGWNVIPELWLGYEKPGTIIREINPRNGPGMNSGEYESCRLYYGDQVYACLEHDGWYLCRFYNNHTNYYGNAYLWVPGDAIRWY